MLKEHKHLPAAREPARFNDTDIQQSYNVMKELRRGLSLHSYTFQEGAELKATTRLVYTTLDGKKHEITATTLTL